MIAVTFDYGQTLAELDLAFLSRRVAERGGHVAVGRLEGESDAAWRAYNDAKREGYDGKAAWCRFMSTLLARAGAAADSAVADIVEFLWREQPRNNLWRKPIPGMFELCRDLRARGIPIGIVSNSEGRLAELLTELGVSELFSVIADSGRLGFEKPDARIFDFAAAALGVAPTELVHVGDAWEADIKGALAVGARAIWITHDAPSDLPEGVVICGTAEDVRSGLQRLGVAA